MQQQLEKKKTTNNLQLCFSLKQWVGFFFDYALSKKKNFYWAWKSFLIVVRHQKSKTFLILEIPLSEPPFLVQKHVDITHIPKPVVVQSLLFLYDFYESSPKLTRNRQYSVQFLSFPSFLSLWKNGEISLPKQWNEDTPVSQRVVSYLLKNLEEYHVRVATKDPTSRCYTLSQLV